MHTMQEAMEIEEMSLIYDSEDNNFGAIGVRLIWHFMGMLGLRAIGIHF